MNLASARHGLGSHLGIPRIFLSFKLPRRSLNKFVTVESSVTTGTPALHPESYASKSLCGLLFLVLDHDPPCFFMV